MESRILVLEKEKQQLTNRLSSLLMITEHTIPTARTPGTLKSLPDCMLDQLLEDKQTYEEKYKELARSYNRLLEHHKFLSQSFPHAAIDLSSPKAKVNDYETNIRQSAERRSKRKIARSSSCETSPIEPWQVYSIPKSLESLPSGAREHRKKHYSNSMHVSQIKLRMKCKVHLNRMKAGKKFSRRMNRKESQKDRVHS